MELRQKDLVIGAAVAVGMYIGVLLYHRATRKTVAAPLPGENEQDLLRRECREAAEKFKERIPERLYRDLLVVGETVISPYLPIKTQEQYRSMREQLAEFAQLPADVNLRVLESRMQAFFESPLVAADLEIMNNIAHRQYGGLKI